MKRRDFISGLLGFLAAVPILGFFLKPKIITCGSHRGKTISDEELFTCADGDVLFVTEENKYGIDPGTPVFVSWGVGRFCMEISPAGYGAFPLGPNQELVEFSKKWGLPLCRDGAISYKLAGSGILK